MTLDTFQRQKGESAKAHAALMLYVEMGAERSLDAVRQKCGKSSRLVERWSSRWNWVERAAAWDTNEAVKRQIIIDRAQRAEIEKWAKRQAQIREEGFSTYLALKAKADEMLKFPLAKVVTQDGRTTIEPADWSFNTAVRMQETALKLGRLSADLSTENLDIDVSKLTTSQLDAARDALQSGKPVAEAIAKADRD